MSRSVRRHRAVPLRRTWLGARAGLVCATRALRATAGRLTHRVWLERCQRSRQLGAAPTGTRRRAHEKDQEEEEKAEEEKDNDEHVRPIPRTLYSPAISRLQTRSHHAPRQQSFELLSPVGARTRLAPQPAWNNTLNSKTEFAEQLMSHPSTRERAHNVKFIVQKGANALMTIFSWSCQCSLMTRSPLDAHCLIYHDAATLW